MAAHADTSIHWGLLTRIRAMTRRLALDQRLAAGANPAGTLRESAFRAAFHAEAG